MKVCLVMFALFVSLHTESVSPSLIAPQPKPNLPILDLKVSYLNKLFTQPSFGLKVGSPIQIYKAQSGDYKVTVSKPS